MDSRYDPHHIARFFDEYAEREWDRHDADTTSLVSFRLHRRYLEQYVSPGDHVLEAGAGAGRFTVELAKLGARVTVGDISPGQLELNREKVRQAGGEENIEGRELLDITDLSRFPDGSFEATVCYGGPISYVFDRADEALAELLRVTRPGGHLLFSVMSLAGGTRRFLEGVLGLVRKSGLETVQQVIQTGDLYGDTSVRGHHCRMYRWRELEALLRRHPCEIVAASAANFLSVRNEELLEEAMSDATLWEAFLEWEYELCREPGALDGGTHIIVVVRRV
jgi:SAM-dependent methyltransferase